MLEAAGVEVAVAEAPWHNPPSIAQGLRSHWTRQPEMERLRNGVFDIVHLTDHALAHHVTRFRQQAALVVTCHDLMPFTTPGYYAPGIEGPLKRFFLRRSINALKQADLVVAVSKFTAGEAHSFARVPAGSIRVVPNVVRSGFEPIPRAEAEAGLSAAGHSLPTGRRVLSVGNDRAYKNLPALFEAMAAPALADAQLVRAGPLTDEHLKQLETLGVSNRLSVVEGLDDSLLACLYSACDVLAQPSIAEGFGIPVIEALACGAPVVTSDGGALPEVGAGATTAVPLAGGAFSSRLADALAVAIASRETESPPRIRGAAEFAPDRVVPKLLAAYEAALARRIARK